MAVNKHIEQIGDTDANIRANLDTLQIAIQTDDEETFVWADDGADKYMYAAMQYSKTAAGAQTFINNQFNRITSHENIYVNEYLYRRVDVADYIRFENDKVTVGAGGNPNLIVEDDKVTTPVDFEVTLDDEKIIVGTGGDGEFYSSGDDVHLHNVTQDADLVLGIDDGGVSKTITWDADVDKLLHSAGTFDFNDDNLTTTGSITGNSFITASDIGRSDDTNLIQLTAADTVLFNTTKFLVGGGTTYFYDVRNTVTATGDATPTCYFEADVTNNDQNPCQAVAAWFTLNYRGSQSESSSNKGSRCIDASAFCYNTATTEYFGGFRLDARNLSTGTVTNMYGLWIPQMLNSGGGTITSIYGLRVDNQTAASIHYGAYLNISSGSNKFNIYAIGTADNWFRGHLKLDSDSKYLYLGAGQDAALYYNGSDLLIYANLVGSGVTKFKDATIHLEVIASGATQAAAGAAANEVWKTSGHATLPDNVLMIGV